MAEADHLTNLLEAPFPVGQDSSVAIRMGGHVIEGLADSSIIDTFIVPWDCYVKGVDYYYKKTSTNDLDGIVLLTVDAAKTVVASLAGEGITNGAQTVHADVASKAYMINKGDKITLGADAGGTTEGGIIHATLHLIPAYVSGRV